MKNIVDFLAKLFAKFYNMLPQSIKITIMGASSYLLSGWGLLVIADLQSLENLNKYQAVGIVALVMVLGAIVNVFQQYAVSTGTKVLASEGDKGTIKILNQKIEDTQALKNE